MPTDGEASLDVVSGAASTAALVDSGPVHRPLLFGLLFTACVEAQLPPSRTLSSTHESPEDGPDAGTAPDPSSVDQPIAVPTSCAPGANTGDGGPAVLCVPGDAFAKRFCNGSHPDVALVLMGKGMPFSRMYMRADVDAWNADGGISTRARLQFDEEMLVLRRRSAPVNGIVAGAGAGYLVMRWDGTCFTLDDGEVTTTRPPAAKHPPIPWRRLTDRTKDALLKSAKIQAALKRRGQHCKGASTGEVSRACEDADTALSVAVVTETRTGLTLPTPDPI